MLGISFKIPNEYDTILYKILENIDLDKQSICKIKEGEVLNENGACFFKDEIYKWIDFETMIKSNKHYPIFLNLQIYCNSNFSQDINNYSEFLDSKCQLILFITDNEYVEVYTKKQNHLNLINKNVTKYHFEDVKYIDQNMVRKEFTAYY